MESDNGEIHLICKIILPFWIDIPNETKLEKEYHNKRYSIEIWQDLWQIDFRSNFQSASFLVKEEGALSRGYLKPRINFDDINPLDLTQEKKYEAPWQYASNKVKSIIVFNIDIPYQENEEKVSEYIKNEKIWEDVKEIIDFFLSIYMYVRLNSNFKKSSIFPLSDDYYSRRNTIFTYYSTKNKTETYLGKFYVYLKIPYYNNYHTLNCEAKTLEFVKERFSRRRDLRLKLDERMLSSIEFARNSRDINLMIVNTCIYLERISSDFLSLKRNLDKSEIDILFKEKGLTYYVECQIPHFLGNGVDPQIINDTIEIVRLRNEIIHYGSNFVFDNEKENKCDNVLKLMEFQKVLMEPDEEKLEFEFKPRVIGIVSEIGLKKKVLVMPFESELEANYAKRNTIYLHKIQEEYFNSIDNIIDEFKPYEIPESFKAFYKMYSNDENFITFFALNPTQNFLNFQFLDSVLDYIKDIDFEELKIWFISQSIPDGILNIFKKVASEKIKIYNNNFGRKVTEEYYSIIVIKEEEHMDTFIKINNLFNSKDEKSILEEEIYNKIGKDNFLILINNYPEYFRKKISDGKFFWTMTGKLKNFRTIINENKMK